MPYRFWELAPKGLNHTVLKLGGAIIDVAIEIKVRIVFLYIHFTEFFFKSLFALVWMLNTTLN